ARRRDRAARGGGRGAHRRAARPDRRRARPGRGGGAPGRAAGDTSHQQRQGPAPGRPRTGLIGDPVHSFDVFRHYERLHSRLTDLDFAGIDRTLVRPEYVTLAKSATMGESNVIAAVHGFLNEFVDDYDFSTFAVVWGQQEVQHHYAFRSWLEAVGEAVNDR